jgi:hypothetical protein
MICSLEFFEVGKLELPFSLGFGDRQFFGTGYGPELEFLWILFHQDKTSR